MFRKLRVKFIAITMVMVAIVMALAFSVVCIVEYQRSFSVVQTTLENAIGEAEFSYERMKDRGVTQKGKTTGGQESSSGSASEQSSANGESSTSSTQSAHSTPPEPGKAYALEPQEEGLGYDWRPDGGQGRNGGQDPRNGQFPGTGGTDPAGGQEPAAEPSGDSPEEGASGEQSGSGGNAKGNPNAEPSNDAASGESSQVNTASTDSAAPASDGSSSSGDNPLSTSGGQTGADAAAGEGGAANAPQVSGEGAPAGDGQDAGESPSDSVTISQDEMGQSAPPNIGNRPGQQRSTSSIVPVAVYRIDASGTLRVIPEVTTASISSDVLQEAADGVMQAQDGFGTLSNVGLHYVKATKDGETFLAFADTSYTDSWKSLALMLAVVGLGTLVVFFVISLFYSQWALRPVKEAWDSQRQFVADASHDLKTPLTVILANAAILLKHPEHTIASESQWVESTQIEAENMQGLVNEMLELAQVEAGQARELVREPIDLSDLVDGETLLFDSVALERGYEFECSIDGGVRILGEEKQIKKMVSTLIENAFKYVDEGGTIGVVLRKTGKNATIAIHNTGSTISEQDLPHIFDRFYRTDKARTSGEGGFGLGLAIARGIALQHDGDITCASSQTDGTTFTISLPTQ
ncbi:MAG: hypothetical protein IJ087_06165 [Eggerthellaceae bacterium]|nr:hypothetical protein [Eggerthellaceae bacterium]